MFFFLSPETSIIHSPQTHRSFNSNNSFVNVQCFLANDCNGHMQTPHKFWCLSSKKCQSHSKTYIHGIWHPSCTGYCSWVMKWSHPHLQLNFIFRTPEGWGPLFCSGEKKHYLKSVSISANPTAQSKFFTGGWMDDMKWTFCSFKLFTFGT